MPRSRLLLSLLMIPALVACLGLAGAQLTGVDLDDRIANPLTADPGKLVVLVFLRQDCPVSSRYAPVIQQISSRFAHDASFFLVYPDRNESAPSIRKYLADYGYALPALRDPEHVLVKQAHAEIT